MIDRVKLIKAWETFRNSNPYQICEGKEFRAFKEPEYCMGQMIADTIALLKEQEPRLLTIEEITGDGECWFEGINGAYGYADCYMCTGSKEVEVHRISMKPEYVSWDDFKKKWRCWSAKPTDEQRQEVKWE